MGYDIAGIAQSVMNNKGYRDKIIEGDTYSIKLLPAFTGLAVGKRLADTALPVIAMIVDQEGKPEYIKEEEEALTSIALLLCNQLDKVDVVETVKLLLQGSLRNGEPYDPDVHFAGNYSLMFEVIALALQENFGSFFTKFLKKEGLEIPSLGSLMKSKAPTSEE